MSHKVEGYVFRDALRAKVEKLIILFAVGNGVSNQSQMAQCGILQPNQAPANLSDDERAEVQFNAVTLTYILVIQTSTFPCLNSGDLNNKLVLYSHLHFGKLNFDISIKKILSPTALP